MQGKIIIIAMF